MCHTCLYLVENKLFTLHITHFKLENHCEKQNPAHMHFRYWLKKKKDTLNEPPHGKTNNTIKRAVTSRHPHDVKIEFGSSDGLTTSWHMSRQPYEILLYSFGNCFDQIKPSRSTMECSGERFRNYVLWY